MYFAVFLSLHIYILIPGFYFPSDTVKLLSVIVFISMVTRKIARGGRGHVQKYECLCLDSAKVTQVIFCN